MKEDIVINGIETNNLKNISVSLKKNAINLIIGPSGSGKSSLAYDTIAQIGLHELGAMYSDGVNEPEYKVDSYSNMVVTIPIKQLNNNNNVRSTVGTYFSLNSCLSKIFSSVLNISYDYFVLNKTENICQDCMGIGYIKKLDPIKIIDYDKTIAEIPVRCWKKNKDFYNQILEVYCKEKQIPRNIKFRDMSETHKNTVLYGKSNIKYKIKYKVTNHISTRTTAYLGPMTGIPMLKTFSPSPEFYSEVACQKCEGQKYEINHRKNKIAGYSIGEVMMLPFNQLLSWVNLVKKNYDYKNIRFSLNQIEAFAIKAVELKLGYIFLNRNIPSLSGGELQRLRLIQVFSSQLSDLLIVLDEPLAGLSVREKKIVYNNIKKLEKKYTLLIVDHHEMFINDAANIYALGIGGGQRGGTLVDVNQYINQQRIYFSTVIMKAKHRKQIKLDSCVYNYKGVDIDVELESLNLISGESGVGKSTLLREYLPIIFDNYLYINQKPLGGSVRSTVATSLNIAGRISQCYSKNFNQNKSFFSNLSSAEGMCIKCSGTGLIVYGSSSQSQIELQCKDCKGTGFDKKLLKYQLHGMSIQDVWNMTIDEGIDFFEDIDLKVSKILKLAQGLLLGYLQIGEKTYNLSGGENIRLKLMNALTANNSIIGIDEPFKGLNSEEIYKVIIELNNLVKQGKTIVVVDHEEGSFKYFSKHIELINDNGILKGK